LNIPGKEVIEMDVNLLNNLPIPTNYIGANESKPNLHNESEFLFKHDENKIKPDDVMMDLEEVKNFLYMLIGGKSIHVSANAEKGLNVNKIA
jgi:hypothetical protein